MCFLFYHAFPPITTMQNRFVMAIDKLSFSPVGLNNHRILPFGENQSREIIGFTAFVVDLNGIEPSTSRMRTERSPS